MDRTRQRRRDVRGVVSVNNVLNRAGRAVQRVGNPTAAYLRIDPCKNMVALALG
jgi:hypothetical protein